MSENINFDCQPASSQKAISSVYSELLMSDDKLNRRPPYQRSLAWDNEQKSKLIDTIMTNCPMPIFLLYMYDPKEEYECIDGQNRLTTIKEYIEQDPMKVAPFAWILKNDKGDEEEYIFFNNEKTRKNMESYCEEQNKKRQRGRVKRTFRIMNQNEMKRFNKYQLSLSLINTELSFNQRKLIFMRWQNGTGISQCDSFKNENYPFCNFVVNHKLDRDLADTVGGLLKSSRNNWLWDEYRLLNAFAKDTIDGIIISTIQARTTIEKEKNTIKYDDKYILEWRNLQERLEKMLQRLKPLEEKKGFMYISFLLGYIFLWKTANSEVRAIAEKEDFQKKFADESLNNDEHNHATLNNGPQVKAFLSSFENFKNTFYCLIGEMTPIPQNPSAKKKETIPSSLKTDVWNTYIGREKGEGSCYCCGKINITQREHHTGHIIPEAHGGASNLENLRPVCGPCNQSMGTQNMHTFMKNYYPQQYANALSKLKSK